MSLWLWVVIALFHRFFATSLPLSNPEPQDILEVKSWGVGMSFGLMPRGMVMLGIDWDITIAIWYVADACCPKEPP